MKMIFPMFMVMTLAFGQKDTTYPTLTNYIHPSNFLIDTTETKNYPFIDLSKNRFQFFSDDSPNWKYFFREFDGMTSNKDRKLNFYHLGGSHLQADIYTHVVRTYLQGYWEELCGERGHVFPFSLAGTNNPSNYKFKSSNAWKGYRSVTNRPDGIEYGLSGIVASCSDSIIKLNFHYDKTTVRPEFNSFRILHNKGAMPYDIFLLNSGVGISEVYTNETYGYTEFILKNDIDSLALQFERKGKGKDPLMIYGITFMNNEPGISYSSIGVNGASLSTYLKNKNFEEQLCLYPPDFFAFSVGTNDANVPNGQFDSLYYRDNLEQMILTVYRCNPNCAILLTVPNDAYYNRKYPNGNLEALRNMVFELARKYKLAVWDFYGIMGESGSSKRWLQSGLMQSDLVHFTYQGYQLKGKLFFDAFLKFLDQMRNTEKMK